MLPALIFVLHCTSTVCCRHMCKLLPSRQPEEVCMADCRVSSCYQWLEVQEVLRDVPQCNCSPLRLYSMSWICYSERCSVGLVSEGGLDQLIRFCSSHIERALASVGVVFTLHGHLVLTKNALTVHVKHKQHHLSWLHSCSPSSHFCRPLSHPLRSRGQCVRLITSQWVETEKVTACHCVSALQQQHECERSYISSLSQDGAKKHKMVNQAEYTSQHSYISLHMHVHAHIHACAWMYSYKFVCVNVCVNG